MGMAERQFIDGIPLQIEQSMAQQRTPEYVAGLEVGSAIAKIAGLKTEECLPGDVPYEMWSASYRHGISNFPPTEMALDEVGHDAFYAGRLAGVHQPIEGVEHE
jgi:hypothetical protein